MDNTQLDELSINTIRMLSADAVEKAKSGHPGLPMGAAAFAYTLWMKYLRFNPKNPDWLNRDRFVLSAGHGSMLLYSLLYLTGYDLTIEDLKEFRQWNSKTPGHPELGMTPGVETTTGPLGQGFANGVGMGLAERFLAQTYNKPGFKLFDYNIYALVSDGDLMEGVSSEAASYAGSLRLGNLIYLYDNNGITIEGSTSLTFCEDTALRFESYGWHTIIVPDGNDVTAVSNALHEAKDDTRPSLILLKTHIGYGSPNKQDKSSAHGSPLGEDEMRATKEYFDWPQSPSFYVPDSVKAHMDSTKRGQVLEEVWNKLLMEYTSKFPKEAENLLQAQTGKLPKNWMPSIDPGSIKEPMATREVSGIFMNEVANNLDLFIGGSADLAPSNNTHLNKFDEIVPESAAQNGRNLHFGIREHAMGGILNGMAISKGIVPFGATFLCFSDYMRPAIRLAAIMELGVIYIFTHDSIGQGEDGTTHQPIEHLASLRAIPNLIVLRPADAYETIESWKIAIESRQNPTAIVLTRQKVPQLSKPKNNVEVKKGAYIIRDCNTDPDIIFIATGSEVYITIEASEMLEKKGIHVRVVSMPSTELFDSQDKAYKELVIPSKVKTRLSVEAASTFGWHKYVGDFGVSIGINHFGSSAPGQILYEKYGFSAATIADKAATLWEKNK